LTEVPKKIAKRKARFNNDRAVSIATVGSFDTGMSSQPLSKVLCTKINVKYFDKHDILKLSCPYEGKV